MVGNEEMAAMNARMDSLAATISSIATAMAMLSTAVAELHQIMNDRLEAELIFPDRSYRRD